MTDRGGGNQGVGHVQAVRQGVFFNRAAPHVADVLRDGQYIAAF